MRKLWAQRRLRGPLTPEEALSPAERALLREAVLVLGGVGAVAAVLALWWSVAP